MGLIKKDGFLVEGIDLIPAYAKIMRIYLGANGNASVVFGVSTVRENLDEGLVLTEINYDCVINKNDKIYTDIYNQAKKELFTDWEDDIPQ